MRRSDTRTVRAFFALLGLVLDMLPILVFAAVAYTVLADGARPADPRPDHVVGAGQCDGPGAPRSLCRPGTSLLPADTGAVFVPLDAETRNYLYIWVRRFVLWAVFGYAVPEAAWWLGVPGAIYALMLNVGGPRAGAP